MDSSLDLVARSHDFSHMIAHLIEGRSFALASFALVVFDYFITVDSEIRHFWSGPWTISRILFLSNRYVSLAVICFRIIAEFLPGLFHEPDVFCDIAIRINFPLNLLALAVVQAILIIRLWYLFTSSKFAQRLLVTVFILCTIGSFVALGVLFPLLHTRSFTIPGTEHCFCRDPPPAHFWLVFVPSFVLHTVLQIYMLVRIYCNVVKGDKTIPLLKRLTRDGGFLYMVIFFSASFSVCAAIFGASPSIGVVAMFANFMLAMLSITVSRVMFHILYIAKRYSNDPCSQDPILLLHTASLSSNNSSRRMSMGLLMFIPPEDQHVDVYYDDTDSTYGWRELDEKGDILENVYY